MKTRIFCTIVLAATLAVGCCNCRYKHKLERPLVGTEWQLVQIMGTDISAKGEEFTMLLHDNGQASGMGNCNRFMATYKTSESRDITFTDISSTRRFCQDIEREMEYFAMLESVTHYEMDAEIMILLSNGTLVGMMKPRAVE